MTVGRRYGNDSPFGAWVRAQNDLDSISHGLTINDMDWIVHKYKTSVDRIGTRKVHLLMRVEVKTRGALPTPEQRETLFFLHQKATRRGRAKEKLVSARDGEKKSVWDFGFFVLSLPGLAPGDVEPWVNWCRFNEDGSLGETVVSVETLKQIIRFDIRPDKLTRLELRRHHKTALILADETMPLGFRTSTILRHES